MSLKAIAVVPAYNESRHIYSLVKSVQKTGLPIIVVDDGSEDDTALRAKEAGAEVVRLTDNRGKGASLQAGFDLAMESDYSAVIAMDGDFQHDPVEIPKFIEAAETNDGVGIVIGNRLHNPKGMPWIRLITNRVMSLVVSRICGQHLPDSQCGYRLIRRPVLETVRLNHQRYDSDSELLIKTSRQGWTILSVPIATIYGDEQSQIRPIPDTIRWFRLLWRLLWNKEEPQRKKI